MKIMKFVTLTMLSAFVLLMPSYSHAVPVTIDQYIYQHYDDSNLVNTSVLSGSADFTFSDHTLTIILKNTSTGSTGYNGATNLLSGLAFNLPTGMSISSGTVYMNGSTAINFTAPSSGNVSGEWGYDNKPISGPFKDIATLSTNTAVSSMVSMTDVPFSSYSIAPPNKTLGGPEMGLLSSNVSASTAGGQNAIRDHVRLNLLLSGSYSGNLVSYIDSRPVVISFGSPDKVKVPEPGTVLLLGTGLAGLWMYNRRCRKNR